MKLGDLFYFFFEQKTYNLQFEIKVVELIRLKNLIRRAFLLPSPHQTWADKANCWNKGFHPPFTIFIIVITYIKVMVKLTVITDIIIFSWWALSPGLSKQIA